MTEVFRGALTPGVSTHTLAQRRMVMSHADINACPPFQAWAEGKMLRDKEKRGQLVVSSADLGGEQEVMV